MKIYYPTSHYNKNFRGQLFPLLKAFIKGKRFTDEDRQAMYGISENDYEFTQAMADAEVVILTMSWNYYVKNKLLDLAVATVQKAAQENKTVWSYNSGDFGVKIPEFNNLKVFRFSGYASKNQLGHRALPVMVKDYLKKHYSLEACLNKTYAKRPVVGFCGQADDNFMIAGKEICRTMLRNLKSSLNLRPEEPQAILSTTNLRASLLKQLEDSSAVQDNFIKRKKYRAGAKKGKGQRQKSTTEFYDNILASDYVLCVRGNGNFSVRFYETLMMGRIPLYIHTDGLLPLANEIDWKEHVIWINYEEIEDIPQILTDFHNTLNPEKLQALFKSNRTLWEGKLRLDGFFKSEFNYI